MNFKHGDLLPGIYPLKSVSAGVYDIPKVQCLEGGYTVIQSRGQYGNPREYFFKDWETYAKGFGKPGKWKSNS